MRKGAASSNLRVLRSSYTKPRLDMTVEGRPGSRYEVRPFTPWRLKEGDGIRLLSAGGQVSVIEISAPLQARANPDKTGYVHWTANVEFLQ
jgi:hypothetical protein